MNPAENYIITRKEPFKSMLLQIQVLIENTFPEATLEYKWKIPNYYYQGKPLCYLNASYKKGFVDVGFWAKNGLKDFEAHLHSEGRSVVKSLRYFSVNDINAPILIAVLQASYNERKVN